MRLLTVKLPPDCDIGLHGDTHFGNALMSRDKLDLFRRWVRRRKSRFWVHMGDGVDAIPTNDPRYYDGESEQDIPLLQVSECVRFYRGISNRCLVWIKGNHPQKHHRIGNLAKEICRRLDVEYGTWTTKLRLINQDTGKQMVKLYLTHSVGNTLNSRAKDYEQRIANMNASLKRRMAPLAGDCLIMAMGHTHKLLNCRPAKRLILYDDGEKIKQKYLEAGDGDAEYIEPDRRWYVNTGSFVKLHKLDTDGYAERAGYDPIELGFIIVKIRKGEVVDVEARTV